jgi:hypothetical protein
MFDKLKEYKAEHGDCRVPYVHGRGLFFALFQIMVYRADQSVGFAVESCRDCTQSQSQSRVIGIGSTYPENPQTTPRATITT